MENQTNSESLNEMKKSEVALGTMIGSALAYFFTMLAFILFVCPFSFWKAATYRLYKECKNKTLFTFTQNSRWPFFSFLKKIFFEFFIDGTIFISYFVGVIVAIVTLFTDAGVLGFITTLIGAYYSPLYLCWIRDIFVLLLLPFQKFISWISKPAQQIDVDFHNHVK